MPEHRGHEVARRPVRAFIIFSHPRCREGLQLVHGQRHGLLIRFVSLRFPKRPFSADGNQCWFAV